MLAAKLRERAQFRNAGNNLTLKAVVLQATYAWPAAMLSARPKRAPDGTQPRGCRNATLHPACMRWLRDFSMHATCGAAGLAAPLPNTRGQEDRQLTDGQDRPPSPWRTGAG